MDLRELILSRKGDRSYAALSTDAGGTPSPGRIQQHASGTDKSANFVDPPSITGLARALHVPTRTVILSNAESLGLDVGREESRLVALMPAGTSRLTDRQVSVILELIDVFLEQPPEPTKPPRARPRTR